MEGLYWVLKIRSFISTALFMVVISMFFCWIFFPHIANKKVFRFFHYLIAIFFIWFYFFGDLQYSYGITELFTNMVLFFLIAILILKIFNPVILTHKNMKFIHCFISLFSIWVIFTNTIICPSITCVIYGNI